MTGHEEQVVESRNGGVSEDSRFPPQRPDSRKNPAEPEVDRDERAVWHQCAEYRADQEDWIEAGEGIKNGYGQ